MIVASKTANNVKELREALDDMILTLNPLVPMDDVGVEDEKGMHLIVELRKNTLTDGSTTYDIVIS